MCRRVVLEFDTYSPPEKQKPNASGRGVQTLFHLIHVTHLINWLMDLLTILNLCFLQATDLCR